MRSETPLKNQHWAIEYILMKKTIMCAVCVSLLCGGLFCLHLTAQSERTAPIPLLDPKIEEQSERGLLELKVASHRELARYVDAHIAVGSSAGTSIRLAEVHAGLYAAESELYRYTGEQDKLLVALQARVDALRDKLRAVVAALEAERVTLDVLIVTEIQLLDALLEQRRANLKEPEMQRSEVPE